MAGKLDEISAAIGEMRADLRGAREDVTELKDEVVENRRIADQRHEENKGRLDAIERTLYPLAKTVADMTPIVESVKLTRLQVGAIVTTLTGLVGGMWWILAHFGGYLIDLARKKLGS